MLYRLSFLTSLPGIESWSLHHLATCGEKKKSLSELVSGSVPVSPAAPHLIARSWCENRAGGYRSTAHPTLGPNCHLAQNGQRTNGINPGVPLSFAGTGFSWCC
ncbi:hypothetical protein PoB_005180500 [Plakobranchus ocellatus]|uniref:Uncharacterized protein n=1 Tax=Plakobranchus ocellatus TaxID=259542 RepID=A0AAV4BY07_9GAST|nr:hypothetical protein PoB_005180500 [Plakobranchus ocellatus]